jgi:hypothetical protein
MGALMERLSAETLVRLLQIYGLAIAKLAPRRTPASGARG